MPRRTPEALTLVENNPEEREDGIDPIYKQVLDIRLRVNGVLEELAKIDPSLLEESPDGKTRAAKIREELDKERQGETLRLVKGRAMSKRR